jgi:hypothetical protein
MAWKLVLVPAYEPDPVQPPTGGAPGVPTHPIYNPGQPAHPIVEPPLGIWGGAPLPVPTPPIYYPPSGGGAPGVPTHPIYNPGVPTHPIVTPPPGFPSHPIAEPPLGIWGGAPLPVPTPPIAMPQPPVDPGYSPPWATPSPPLPVIDPDDIPDHPDVPDLARGVWIMVEYGGLATRAFMPGPKAHVELPNYNPTFPPDQSLPGTWVVVYSQGVGAAWAWIPESVPTQPHPEPPPTEGHPDNTLPGDLPHPDQGLPGEQPGPDNTLPGDLPHPDQGLPGDQPHPEPRGRLRDRT